MKSWRRSITTYKSGLTTINKLATFSPKQSMQENYRPRKEYRQHYISYTKP
jgi:hypothetical protein